MSIHSKPRHGWRFLFAGSTAVVANLVLALLIAWSGNAAAAVRAQEDPPPPPLHGLDKRYSYLPLDLPNAGAYLSYNTLGKNISSRWILRVGSDYHTIFRQIERVSFWPTEVCALDDGRLLVAGKRPRIGSTVIELWTLGEVTSVPVGVRNPTTVQVEYPEWTVPIVSREVVYEEVNPERDMVLLLFRNEGKDDSVFVHFWSSRDFYELDVENGSLTRLFRSSGSGPEPVFPSLANPYNSAWSGEHSVNGYVYVLTNGGVDDSTFGPVIFLDTDRDGALDFHLESDTTTWVQLGLHVSESYVRLFDSAP